MKTTRKIQKGKSKKQFLKCPYFLADLMLSNLDHALCCTIDFKFFKAPSIKYAFSDVYLMTFAYCLENQWNYCISLPSQW